jgi:hypothetical protein
MTDRDKDILSMVNGSPNIIIDAFSFMLGEKLGEGETRAVYDYVLDPNWVVKIAKRHPNDNVLEFDIWHLVKNMQESKWFAECKWLSPSGHLMLQRKTKPLSKLPDLLPNVFTDIHLNNFGKIGNQVVCHDYAFTLVRLIYLTKIKLVDWKKIYKKRSIISNQ